MPVSRALSRLTRTTLLAGTLIVGLMHSRPALPDGLYNPATAATCGEAKPSDGACNLAATLDQHLVNQAALTIWLNANTTALELLWQRHVATLMSSYGIPEEDAVRAANASVRYGALNAKSVLQARGRPVANLLLDGAAFSRKWEAEHRTNPVEGSRPQ